MKKEIIKDWLVSLYDDAIAEARSAVENERGWMDGSIDASERDTHRDNIELQEEYIEVLENLKSGI